MLEKSFSYPTPLGFFGFLVFWFCFVVGLFVVVFGVFFVFFFFLIYLREK